MHAVSISDLSLLVRKISLSNLLFDDIRRMPGGGELLCRLPITRRACRSLHGSVSARVDAVQFTSMPYDVATASHMAAPRMLSTAFAIQVAEAASGVKLHF